MESTGISVIKEVGGQSNDYAVSMTNGIESRPEIYFKGQALTGVKSIEIKTGESDTELHIRIHVDKFTANMGFIQPLQN